MASPSSRFEAFAHYAGAFGVGAHFCQRAVEAAEAEILAAVACVRLLVWASLNCFAHGGLGQQFRRRDEKATRRPGERILLMLPQWASQSRSPGMPSLSASMLGGGGRRSKARRRGRPRRSAFGARGDFEDALAAFERAWRRWVAEGGDQVDELWFVLVDQLFQLVGLHAIGVDRRGDQFGAIKPEALDGGREGRALDDDLVARA